MYEELEKLYQQNIDYSLRYLIAVEHKLINNFSGKELDVENDTTIIAKIDGVLGEYTIDKVKATELLNGVYAVDLHISKRNSRKEDRWVISEKLFGDRLDLVYNKIIWEKTEE